MLGHENEAWAIDIDPVGREDNSESVTVMLSD